jgi:hypothetical protein
LVIPVGIDMRRDLCARIRSKIAGNPTEGNWYLRGPYAITVGEPMRFKGDIEDHLRVRNVTEAIMQQIRLLAHESRYRIQGLKPAAASV